MAKSVEAAWFKTGVMKCYIAGFRVKVININKHEVFFWLGIMSVSKITFLFRANGLLVFSA